MIGPQIGGVLHKMHRVFSHHPIRAQGGTLPVTAGDFTENIDKIPSVTGKHHTLALMGSCEKTRCKTANLCPYNEIFFIENPRGLTKTRAVDFNIGTSNSKIHYGSTSDQNHPKIKPKSDQNQNKVHLDIVEART